MPVAGPDLQIRVGGGLKEKCFRPFRSQFGLKIRGRPGPPGPGPPGPRAPGPLPWMRHSMQFSNIVNIVSHFNRDDGDLRQEGYKLPLSNGQSLFQACTGSD